MKKFLPILLILTLVFSCSSVFALEGSVYNEDTHAVDIEVSSDLEPSLDLEENSTNYHEDVEEPDFLDFDDPILTGSDELELVYEDEDTKTYKMTVPGASILRYDGVAESEIYYEFSGKRVGTGSNTSANISVTIWYEGSKPATHDLKFMLKNGNTPSSCNSTGDSWSTKNIPPKSNPKVITASNNKNTKFWRLHITGTLGGNVVNYSSYKLLYNKAGVRYPDVEDTKLGKVVNKVPNSATWAKVSEPMAPLTQSQRKAYIQWYENKYNNGKSLNFTSDDQIHHIKPRIYGGTHANSNLMPLKSSVHTTVTSWWAQY